MRIICIICFFVNIMLFTVAILNDTGLASMILSLVCAGLCLAAGLIHRVGK